RPVAGVTEAEPAEIVGAPAVAGPAVATQPTGDRSRGGDAGPVRPVVQLGGVAPRPRVAHPDLTGRAGAPAVEQALRGLDAPAEDRAGVARSNRDVTPALAVLTPGRSGLAAVDRVSPPTVDLRIRVECAGPVHVHRHLGPVLRRAHPRRPTPFGR